MTGSHARIEVVDVGGNPDERELRAVEVAIEHLAASEADVARPSLWALRGRSPSGVGLVDHRDDVGRDELWRLSAVRREGWPRP